MMSGEIKECRACKKEVSVTAKQCPHCGEKDPAKGLKEHIMEKTTQWVVFMVMAYIAIEFMWPLIKELAISKF